MSITNTLEVFYENKLIFASTGKWLYPIFELETFLKKNLYPRNRIRVKDKIAGKASALLLIYLGCRFLHAELLSELAVGVLKEYDVEFTFDKKVHRIACKTEKILEEINDPAKAYAILKERANQ